MESKWQKEYQQSMDKKTHKHYFRKQPLYIKNPNQPKHRGTLVVQTGECKCGEVISNYEKLGKKFKGNDFLPAMMGKWFNMGLTK
jgi:hypothetical protein|tara:strand:- start:199 stop:453 length:255 start_codon:yes stop_codon:yes gene_type:complete